MTTTELLVILPVLGRPHRAVPLLTSLRDATPEPFNVRVVASRGDHAVIGEYVTTMADLGIKGCVDLLVKHTVGDYAAKVNHAYRTSAEPFMFLGADDLAFHAGWWTSARAVLDRDPTIGVLGTNDLAPTKRARRGEHATHSVVRRSYVTENGLIDGSDGVLYEGYVHEYVDDELIGTAKKRGAWGYDVNSVVEHLHPHWGKGNSDAMYRQSTRRMVQSRAVFRRRQQLWT